MRVTMIAAILVCLLPALSPASADSLITMKSHSDGMPAMGQPPTDVSWTIWFGDGVLRQDREGMSFIVNGPEKQIFIVMHDSKTYQAISLPLDLTKMIPEPAREMYEQQAAMLEMDVEVTPTDQVREIAGRTAKLSRVKLSNAMGMNMEMDMWMTTELGIDTSVLKDLTSQIVSVQPMGAEWMKEIYQIEGYPVLQEGTLTIMGSEVKSREELVSVEEKDAPAGTYLPPADYEQKPFSFMPEGMAAPAGR